MTYLLEIDAYDATKAAVVTLTYGTDGYVTRPNDTRPNTFYDPRVQQPGNYERHAFSPGTTGGEVTIGTGEIVLVNPDGVLDPLIDLAFDGRAVRIFRLDSPAAAFSTAVPVFRGTLDQAEFGYSKVTLRIRDRLAQLQVPLQTMLYAGTTISGGLAEAEGRPEDLKGQPKPLLFGRARGISAPQANAYDLIYQVSSKALASIEAVYDKGVLLTASTNYPTVAALRGATIPAGQYATCLTLGLFRLSSTPAGQVTVDATEGATLADRSAARVAQRILAQISLQAGDLATATFDALHTVQPAEVGIWLDTSAHTVIEAVTAILGSIGAYLIPDRLGVFRVGRLQAPAGTPVISFDSDIDILDRGQGIERVTSNDQGSGIPTYQVTVQYGRNYTVQTAGDLNQVNSTVPYRAFATMELRTAVAKDDTVKVAHLLATDLTFTTYFTTEADATAEAARLLALYKVRRDRYNIPVKPDAAASVDLGQVSSVTSRRFGMATGKPFIVIGMIEDFGTGVTTLDLWG